MPTTTSVAVKIQYPGVDEAIAAADAAIAELETAVVSFNECVTQAIETLFEKYGRIE